MCVAEGKEMGLVWIPFFLPSFRLVISIPLLTRPEIQCVFCLREGAPINAAAIARKVEADADLRADFLAPADPSRERECAEETSEICLRAKTNAGKVARGQLKEVEYLLKAVIRREEAEAEEASEKDE